MPHDDGDLSGRRRRGTAGGTDPTREGGVMAGVERDSESYVSDDPDKRARQLANLPNLRGEATAGSWAPGAAPALRHGLRSRRPPSIVLDPLVREIEEALAADLPLQAPEGGAPPADRYTVELAALALLRVRRVSAYLELHGDTDAKGNLRPELDGLGRALEQAAKMLDRLGMSPRSRAALGLDVARSFDLAGHWARAEADGGAA